MRENSMPEETNNDEWNTIVPMDNWDTGLRPEDSTHHLYRLNNRVEQSIRDDTKQQKTKSTLYTFIFIICLSALIFGYKIIHTPSESEKSITIKQVFPDKTYEKNDRYGDIKDQY